MSVSPRNRQEVTKKSERVEPPTITPVSALRRARENQDAAQWIAAAVI